MLPKRAIFDDHHSRPVTVLSCVDEDFFMILVARPGGWRRVFTHRSRLQFIPDPPVSQQDSLQDELPPG